MMTDDDLLMMFDDYYVDDYNVDDLFLVMNSYMQNVDR